MCGRMPLTNLAQTYARVEVQLNIRIDAPTACAGSNAAKELAKMKCDQWAEWPC